MKSLPSGFKFQPSHLTLRRAGPQDCRLLWEWTNDPQVRSSAFSPTPIPWEQHVLWFERKLRSSTCAIFVGMDGPLPCGQVRFDWDALGEAEVDVSVDRALRGVGLGSVLLHCAAVEVFTNTPTRVIHAHVKSANFASIRAFEKAGFRRGETALFNGHEAVHLILKRDNV